ncbi:hypothetical protein [Deinococcus aestuarii]|uniref:hypothetical protein n=1 Tax=Deinococcus aestuarii TaxID=2774531 RepID=UPI001C0BB3F0|nr:hypothetical protein [Deinococcus aestuarii]
MPPQTVERVLLMAVAVGEWVREEPDPSPDLRHFALRTAQTLRGVAYHRASVQRFFWPLCLSTAQFEDHLAGHRSTRDAEHLFNLRTVTLEPGDASRAETEVTALLKGALAVERLAGLPAAPDIPEPVELPFPPLSPREEQLVALLRVQLALIVLEGRPKPDRVLEICWEAALRFRQLGAQGSVALGLSLEEQVRQARTRMHRALRSGQPAAQVLEGLLREVVAGEGGPSTRTVGRDLQLAALLEHLVKTSPVMEDQA